MSEYEYPTSLDEDAIGRGAITESEQDINESLDIYGDYDERDGIEDGHEEVV